MLRPNATLWTRRGLVASAAALAACGRDGGVQGNSAPMGQGGPPTTIEAAVAGEWRSAADKARDSQRHPIESLTFWGLKAGETVVEMWPGAGWYTDIIAPYLAATDGKLYAALQPADDPNEPAAAQLAEAYRAKLEAKPKLYGKVEFTAFGPTSGRIAPEGTADLVLFLRNLHNWMAAGIAEKAFLEARAALKPGGLLGVEEHRAAPGGVQDVLAKDGYVQQAYVIQMAREAGFIFDGDSEVNANPKDSRNHPFGVWTLPPVRRSSPRGEPADPAFDRAAYDAIGESDRMTLRFKRPLE